MAGILADHDEDRRGLEAVPVGVDLLVVLVEAMKRAKKFFRQIAGVQGPGLLRPLFRHIVPDLRPQPSPDRHL